MHNFRWFAAGLVLLLPRGWADVRGCVCDLAQPDTMTARECSLCREVEKHPAEPRFFAIKDASPNKPNRWLVLPRFHGTNPQDMDQMSPEDRTAYWATAIAKGKELWGDRWGLAVNSMELRTQCHAHIHVGKLREGVEDHQFVTVDGPADIPARRPGDGLWVHPAGSKLHVHSGDPAPELLLEH